MGAEDPEMRSSAVGGAASTVIAHPLLDSAPTPTPPTTHAPSLPREDEEAAITKYEEAGTKEMVEEETKTGSIVPVVADDLVFLTFLLLSGRRRTMSFPATSSISRVKEIAWNTWPEAWSSAAVGSDPRPLAPAYIRLLYLGKVLMDDVSLETLKLPRTPGQAPVVHLSVRPFLPESETEGGKKSKKGKNQQQSDGQQQVTGAGAGAAGEDAAGGTHGGGCCSSCIIC